MNPKLQNYRTKIQKLEQQFKEVEPPYKEARTKFEKILNSKGVELLTEWGVCGDDIKVMNKLKTKALNEETKQESLRVHTIMILIFEWSLVGYLPSIIC